MSGKRSVAVFVDNDYGRNGISVLENELAKKMLRISYKVALPLEFGLNNITDSLNKSKLVGTRVYVVHLDPDSGLAIFSIAEQLQMMTSNYVWLATDWISAALDSFPFINGTLLRIPTRGCRVSSTYSGIQPKEYFLVSVERIPAERVSKF
ncbi:hypothetical protein L1049_009667 [Liquidambar formosana]|uniref:Receptor ligand binding region domain-containing protein n=1 Tax=Liquidambar formosana TaxID=63359 RepID=A0AAP0N8T9_LIQFO